MHIWLCYAHLFISSASSLKMLMNASYRHVFQSRATRGPEAALAVDTAIHFELAQFLFHFIVKKIS